MAEQYYGIRVGITGVDQTIAKLTSMSSALQQVVAKYEATMAQINRVGNQQHGTFNAGTYAQSSAATTASVQAFHGPGGIAWGQHGAGNAGYSSSDANTSMQNAARAASQIYETSFERASVRMGAEIQRAILNATKGMATSLQAAGESARNRIERNNLAGGAERFLLPSAVQAFAPFSTRMPSDSSMVWPSAEGVNDSPQARAQFELEKAKVQHAHRVATDAYLAQGLGLTVDDPRTGKPKTFLDTNDPRLMGRLEESVAHLTTAFESAYRKISGSSYGQRGGLIEKDPLQYLRAMGVGGTSAAIHTEALNAQVAEYQRLSSMQGVPDPYAWSKSMEVRERYLRSAADDPSLVTQGPQGKGMSQFLSDATGGVGPLRYATRSSGRTAFHLAEAGLLFGGLGEASQGFRESLETQKDQISLKQIAPGSEGYLSRNIEGLSSKYGVKPTEGYDIGFKMQATFGNAADSLKATNAVMLLSKTSTIELKNAMTDLVAITDAWGGGAEKMADKVNGLIALQNKFGGSVEDNLQALARLAPLFKEYGFDDRTATSAVDVIHRATGASGTELASKFERIFPKLSDPATQAILAEVGVKEKIGVDATTFSGPFNGMEVLKKFQQSFTSGGMGQADFKRLTLALGGTRNAADAAVLLSSGPGIEERNRAQSIGERDKSAESRFSALQGSALQQLDQFRTNFILLVKNIAELGLLQVFGGIAKALSEVASIGARVLGWVNQFTSALGPLGDALKAVAVLAGGRVLARRYMSSDVLMGATVLGSGLGSKTDELGQVKATMTRAEYYASLRGVPAILGAGPGSGDLRDAERLRALDRGAVRASILEGAGLTATGTALAGTPSIGAVTYSRTTTRTMENIQAALARGESINPALLTSAGMSAVNLSQGAIGPFGLAGGPLKIDESMIAGSVGSVGAMTAFREGLKGGASLITESARSIKDVFLAATVAVRGFIFQMRASSLLGMAPGGASPLRGYLEGRYANNLVRRGVASAGMAEGQAGYIASRLGGGSLAAGALGEAVVPLAIAGGAYMAIRGISNSLKADTKADADFNTSRQNFLADKGRTGDAGALADLYATSAKDGSDAYNESGKLRKAGRFFDSIFRPGSSGSQVNSTTKYSDIDWSKFSKADLKKLDINVNSDGTFTPNASSLAAHAGAADLGDQKRTSDQYVDDRTMKRISDLYSKKSRDDYIKFAKSLNAAGVGGGALPVDILTFQEGNTAFSSQYGGKTLNVSGNPNDPNGASSVNVGTQASFADVIKKKQDDIFSLQEQIDYAVSHNNDKVARELTDARQKMIADLDTLQTASDQANAAIISFYGTAAEGTRAVAQAADKTYQRSIAAGGNPNDPANLAKKLAALQANQAAISAPFDSALTDNAALMNLVVVPQDKISFLQAAATNAANKAKSLIAFLGGTGTPVVRQAMATAVEVNKQLLDGINAANLDAIQASQNRVNARTMDPVARARAALIAANARVAEDIRYEGSSRGTLSGNSGNPLIDQFVKALGDQNTQSSDGFKASADQMDTSATSLTSAATDLSGAAAALNSAALLLSGNTPANSGAGNASIDPNTDPELRHLIGTVGSMDVDPGKAGYHSPATLSYQGHTLQSKAHSADGYYYYEYKEPKDQGGKTLEYRVDKNGNVSFGTGKTWAPITEKAKLPQYSAPANQIHPEWFHDGTEADVNKKWAVTGYNDRTSSATWGQVDDTTHKKLYTFTDSTRPSGSTTAAGGTAGLSISDFMGKLRGVESGGDYTATSKSSTASGAYQYLDSSWNHYGGYARASMAPKAVQDARAQSDIQAALIKYNGDYRYVAAAHFAGAGWLSGYTDKHGVKHPSHMDPSTWNVTPVPGSNGGETVAQYVAKVLGGGVAGSLNAGGGAASDSKITGDQAAAKQAAYDFAKTVDAQKAAWRNASVGGTQSQGRAINAQMQNLMDQIKTAKQYGDMTAVFSLQAELQKVTYQRAIEGIAKMKATFMATSDDSNTVLAAKERLKEIIAQEKAYLANGGKKTDREYIDLQGQAKDAARDQNLAIVNQGLSDINYQYTMHKLGFGQYIQQLTKLRDTTNTSTRAGLELWRQINEQIQGLVDSLTQQFNIPTNIKLPTLYEVRRSIAAGTADAYAGVGTNVGATLSLPSGPTTMGLHANSVMRAGVPPQSFTAGQAGLRSATQGTTNHNTITIVAKGADANQVARLVVRAIGTASTRGSRRNGSTPGAGF